MIRLFFLLPIIMCAIWWWYINSKGYRVRDARTGFYYIIAFNSVIIGFFILMMFITN